jgi:hypothetical protein
VGIVFFFFCFLFIFASLGFGISTFPLGAELPSRGTGESHSEFLDGKWNLEHTHKEKKEFWCDEKKHRDTQKGGRQSKCFWKKKGDQLYFTPIFPFFWFRFASLAFVTRFSVVVFL